MEKINELKKQIEEQKRVITRLKQVNTRLKNRDVYKTLYDKANNKLTVARRKLKIETLRSDKLLGKLEQSRNRVFYLEKRNKKLNSNIIVRLFNL